LQADDVGSDDYHAARGGAPDRRAIAISGNNQDLKLLIQWWCLDANNRRRSGVVVGEHAVVDLNGRVGTRWLGHSDLELERGGCVLQQHGNV
jgi:hypothetical protein